MTMTKADLINALAADTGLTKADADRFWSPLQQQFKKLSSAETH